MFHWPRRSDLLVLLCKNVETSKNKPHLKGILSKNILPPLYRTTHLKHMNAHCLTSTCSLSFTGQLTHTLKHKQMQKCHNNVTQTKQPSRTHLCLNRLPSAVLLLCFMLTLVQYVAALSTLDLIEQHETGSWTWTMWIFMHNVNNTVKTALLKKCNGKDPWWILQRRCLTFPDLTFQTEWGWPFCVCVCVWFVQPILPAVTGRSVLSEISISSRVQSWIYIFMAVRCVAVGLQSLIKRLSDLFWASFSFLSCSESRVRRPADALYEAALVLWSRPLNPQNNKSLILIV